MTKISMDIYYLQTLPSNVKCLETIDIFIMCIVVMISRVYTYNKTDQIVCFKYVQFTLGQLYKKNTMPTKTG